MEASWPEALRCSLLIGRPGRSRGRELVVEVPCSRGTVHFCGVLSPEAGCVGETETGAEGTPCPVSPPANRPALPQCQLVRARGVGGRSGWRHRRGPCACTPAFSVHPLPPIYRMFYRVPVAEISREYMQRCHRLKSWKQIASIN